VTKPAEKSTESKETSKRQQNVRYSLLQATEWNRVSDSFHVQGTLTETIQKNRQESMIIANNVSTRHTTELTRRFYLACKDLSRYSHMDLIRIPGVCTRICSADDRRQSYISSTTAAWATD